MLFFSLHVCGDFFYLVIRYDTMFFSHYMSVVISFIR